MNIDKKSNLRMCFVDNAGGCYLPAALIMSKHFSKTYYHIPNQSPFPRISSHSIGKGYEEIEVIDSIWDNLDNIDIFVLGDIYMNDLANFLRRMGKLVFGGTGEIIETNRKLFKEILERLDMPVAPTQYVLGVKLLKKYLKTKKNKYVKVSYWRGELETFEYINLNYNMVQLDEIEFNL
jgi:phosphoribosylamine-glycine ligase